MVEVRKGADERARLSLAGLSVGDAFGERFFLDPAAAAIATKERWLPSPPWRWTDDTAMALSIVDELREQGRIVEDRLAAAFARRWAREPWRGYGGGAHRILEEIHHGGSWKAAAGSAFGGAGSMGNGAAMRAAPIGAYFAGDMERVVDEARKSAVVTHANAEGIAGAIAVAVAAAAASERADAATVFAQLRRWTPASLVLEGIARAQGVPFETPATEAAAVLGAGAQVLATDTVPFCAWCACRHLDNFEEALWQTVSGLGDRDTTCAIVGGIVVLSTGADGIPAAWLAAREPLDARPPA